MSSQKFIFTLSGFFFLFSELILFFYRGGSAVITQGVLFLTHLKVQMSNTANQKLISRFSNFSFFFEQFYRLLLVMCVFMQGGREGNGDKPHRVLFFKRIVKVDKLYVKLETYIAQVYIVEIVFYRIVVIMSTNEKIRVCSQYAFTCFIFIYLFLVTLIQRLEVIYAFKFVQYGIRQALKQRLGNRSYSLEQYIRLSTSDRKIKEN